MQSTDVFVGWWYILLVEVERCENEAEDAAYATIAVRGEDELNDWSAIRRCAT